MAIKTPDGENLRRHLLSLEGIDESLLDKLEKETIDYLRLFFNIRFKEVISPDQVGENEKKYMDKSRPGRREWGELTVIPTPIMPADVVTEQRQVPLSSAYPLRQYVKSLILSGIRQFVVKGTMEGLDNVGLLSSFEQVADMTPLDQKFLDPSHKIRSVLGDISEIWDPADTTEGSRPEITLSFNLGSDLHAEFDFYSTLLFAKIAELKYPDHNFLQNMPVATMKVSHMRSKNRQRKFGVIRPETSATDAFEISAGAIVHKFVADGRADMLSESDKNRYLSGDMPWQIVAEYYRVADRPEVVQILQESFRTQLCMQVARSVSENWRPKDPFDDWDDFDD
jgi:hypothetical protein